MKGDAKVIELLDDLCGAELAARDQYFIHSEIYKDMGLDKLHERLSHEMEEETEHARRIMERMLFLEARPSMKRTVEVKIGQDLTEMLRNDLAIEYAVGNALKEAMAHCESVKDYVTKEMLLGLLDDTEMDHTYWLEQQLRLIDLMGMENYIQSHAGSSGS
ncbi:bacterioferritin [Rhodovibrionaceae bacterium A322]